MPDMMYFFKHLVSIFLLCQLVRTATISFCHPFPSVVLDDKETVRFENGSLLHNGLLYPPALHRVINNRTRACVCSLDKCLRKCCPKNSILQGGIRPNCNVIAHDLLATDLRLDQYQIAPEIYRAGGIANFFTVVTGRDTTMKCFLLEPDDYEEDVFFIEANGTLRTAEVTMPPSSYCLDWQENYDKVVALICPQIEIIPEDIVGHANPSVLNVGILISIPFLFVTFLVYAIIPELRNLYGKTLMCYVASLVVAYTFLVATNYFHFPYTPCYAVAITIHFSFLASFFWLNVMCFDIWWTFGGFRSLQGSVKQRERKKFIMYSIYAWGSSSLLTGVCIVMDFAPGVPDHFIRPQFGAQSCWFTTDAAKAVYFYGPMGITVLCNICLFVSTALKIIRHKKDTAHTLKGSESRRHDDNKQWFNLYLKLFIVMGINWSMEIVSWLCKETPQYVWYITDLTNTLQGLIIFLIFVCKEKIKRLLLKRFGCLGRDILSRNSTRSAYHSSASRTCMTSAAPLQEKVNPYVTESYRTRSTFDDSECA